ncbi:MAG: tagatose 1,6-diphosphate aldolase [Burkholderiales bacterium]|nr:tagatose 1,6-diphosphate aldolase [Burkholderiales bacterium]
MSGSVLTPGKAWGLRRLADAAGNFMMLAVDQRPPIAELVARGRGVPAVAAGFADIAAVKRCLAEALAPHATATLVDPNFAYPAAIAAVPASRGLLLTLEEHRFEETPHGRKSSSIPGWSVAKIRRLGADAVKVLAWYRPDASEAAKAHQRAYVAAVGEECRRHDIAFVFELLVYPFPGERGHTSAYLEDGAKRPEAVLASVAEFADPRYGVDLFKIESPIPAPRLPDPRSRAAVPAQAWFDRIAATLAARDCPWVMLSAGAGKAEFERVLTYAYRAGANGYLAGRAIWWEALRAFPDLAACRARLAAEAVPYMRRLNRLTSRRARPWHADARFDVTREGDFARGYPDCAAA